MCGPTSFDVIKGGVAFNLLRRNGVCTFSLSEHEKQPREVTVYLESPRFAQAAFTIVAENVCHSHGINMDIKRGRSRKTRERLSSADASFVVNAQASKTRGRDAKDRSKEFTAVTAPLVPAKSCTHVNSIIAAVNCAELFRALPFWIVCQGGLHGRV